MHSDRLISALAADHRRNPAMFWERFNGDASAQQGFYGAFLETARAHTEAPTALLGHVPQRIA